VTRMHMALLRRHPRLQPVRRVSSEVRVPSSTQWHLSRQTLYVLCVQLNAPRRANVPSVETTYRSASSGSINHTLESTRVQTILDHVGDLDVFSDPHAPPHAPYVRPPPPPPPPPYPSAHTQTHVLRSLARRHTAPSQTSTIVSSRLAKTLGAIKRRRKARNMALRAATRDEDDLPLVGKGQARAGARKQCPVCMRDVEGDPDVVTAHVDACLAHGLAADDMDADEDAPQDVDVDDDVDLWEESVARRRAAPPARGGSRAAALGFAVGDRTAEDVEDEIDVKGDDLGIFGAAQFTEADVLAESGDGGQHAVVDLEIERARDGEDLQEPISALESKVRRLAVRLLTIHQVGCCLLSNNVHRTPRQRAQRWDVVSASRRTANRQWARTAGTHAVARVGYTASKRQVYAQSAGRSLLRAISVVSISNPDLTFNNPSLYSAEHIRADPRRAAPPRSERSRLALRLLPLAPAADPPPALRRPGAARAPRGPLPARDSHRRHGRVVRASRRFQPELISPCEPFFSHILPQRLLPAPAFVHLEALALSFSDPVGVFYLSCNFAELFFPELRALRLQHVQFSAARDAEHLVTRHANTHLELHLAHNGKEGPQPHCRRCRERPQ
jgi:hypothetical protein